ncbi:MAG: phosphoesterase [Gammaproteobacteria bacterium CG12_big_fil_rev_8_21_14_0_65_46_12]|nr:MAG: phosphoesterase [Gammaproteobacteria bacterium CG12_big_fil_rev_8_21_14_0_65_46_12]
MAAMWISFLVFVMAVVIWFIFKREIVTAIFYIKSGELWLVGLVWPKAEVLRQQMLNTPIKGVDIAELVGLVTEVGTFYMIPVMILLVILGALLFNRGVGTRFKTVYTMKTLLAKEYKNWPQITPVVKEDLVSIDIDQGPWAMAKTPMEFAKTQGLLKIQRRALEEGMLRKDAKLVATLVKPKANQLFVKQLGPLWRGTEALPMHVKALFAAFAARIAGDAEASHALLMQIAASANGGKLNFSGVKALLAKHENNPLVETTVSHHAYVLTVMASILNIARASGVLASADFLWLKVIDRRLWYMLNAVGRQTPTVEVAGPFGHWCIEATLERPFKTPMIENATHALDEAIQSQIYSE